MDIKELNNKLNRLLEFISGLEEPVWELEEYLSNNLDNIYGFEWHRDGDLVYFTKGDEQVIYDETAFPVPIITYKLGNKIIEQVQMTNRHDIDTILNRLI